MTVTRSKSDPLLTTARYVLGGAMGVCAFATTMTAIGLGAVLTVQRQELNDKLALEGVADGGYLAVVVGLILIVTLLALTFLFLRELFRIVGSVRMGDPFVPINADRLQRMAWMNLVIQFLLVAVASIAVWFRRMSTALLAEDALNLAVGATLLTLVLFILARVFRVGAAMREELEGTI